MPPRLPAERIACSASYLAKILRVLVKAGILRSIRGIKGGVILERQPSEITLLAVVEACQGVILGDYCREGHLEEQVCSYPRAMKNLHGVLLETLSACTLEDLLVCPAQATGQDGSPRCKIVFDGFGR